MGILTQNEIQNVIQALIASGLDTNGNRSALLQFINRSFVTILPTGGIPVAQLMTDLGMMNDVERLTTGEIPLQI